jgi:hypothetical protein
MIHQEGGGRADGVYDGRLPEAFEHRAALDLDLVERAAMSQPSLRGECTEHGGRGPLPYCTLMIRDPPDRSTFPSDGVPR